MSTSAKTVPSLKLNDGHEIPVLAYGLGSALYKAHSEFEQKIVDSAQQAIELGFTHLDGAEVYGNEEELGIAIKAAGVPRDKLFVVTKWNPTADPAKTIEQAFASSLAKIGVDYVDLYLVHNPFFANGSAAELQKRWAEVEAIRASGRARSIGVSNFSIEHLEAVLATAKVPPAINQIEYHPYLQHGPAFRAFHRDHNIAIAAYGGLTPILRAPGGPVDPVLADLASKYGVTVSDVGLRWLIDCGIVAVTTSNNADRIKGYLSRVPAFQLTSDEVERITAAGNKKHFRAFWDHVFDKDDRS